MIKDNIVVCPVCGKKYRVEIVNYPVKLEEGRQWETFYSCPYCNDNRSAVKIQLYSDQDVKSYKLD